MSKTFDLCLESINEESLSIEILCDGCHEETRTLLKEDLFQTLIQNTVIDTKNLFTIIQDQLISDIMLKYAVYCDDIDDINAKIDEIITEIIETWKSDLALACPLCKKEIEIFPDVFCDEEIQDTPEDSCLINASHEYIPELPLNYPQDCSPQFTAYNKEKFAALYPTLHFSKDNERRILEIKNQLEGNQVNVEYTPELISEMNHVFDSYPNFEDLREVILPDEELLCLKNSRVIKLPNILIYSEPGCGKSSLLLKICDIYKHYYRISMGTGSVAFTLGGNDKGYTESDCGSILKSMFSNGDGPVMNPLVILDEIDKANYTNKNDSDLSGILAEILEKNNAKHFVDNFFGVEVDASNINYIALANDITKLPDFVLSRFPIKIKIRPYTEEELKTVVLDNQYEQWININNINKELVPAKLIKQTRNLIAKCSHNHPREVDNVLSEIAKMTLRFRDDKYFADFEPSDSERQKLINKFSKYQVEESHMGFKM